MELYRASLALTLRYPTGRDLILIANDVTHQAGSFGVREDQRLEKPWSSALKRPKVMQNQRTFHPKSIETH